jgi:hypothetical protein
MAALMLVVMMVIIMTMFMGMLLGFMFVFMPIMGMSLLDMFMFVFMFLVGMATHFVFTSLLKNVYDAYRSILLPNLSHCKINFSILDFYKALRYLNFFVKN